MIGFDQIAIYVEDIEAEVDRLSSAGYDEWVRDTVTATMAAPHDGHQFQAHLAFNYDVVPKMEFELIQPVSQPNYIDDAGLWQYDIAHLGFHIDEERQEPPWLQGAEVIQDVETVHHANRGVPKDRYYHYKIYSCPVMPWPVKVIERCSRNA